MRWRLLTFLLVIITAVLMLAAEPALTLAEVVNKHLSSIGTQEQRAALKTRVVAGTSQYKILNGGSGEMTGPATFLGEGKNLRIVMKYSNPEYRGEDLLTDGSRVQVYGNPKRSLMGQFLWNQSALLSEGILGGTLTPAWPLLDTDARSAKLTYEGLKKIDGTELHEIKYVPKKKTDLDIRIYLDKDTFRHVLTVATATIKPELMSAVGQEGDFMNRSGDLRGGAIGGDTGTNAETSTVRQQTMRYRIEQRFTDYQNVDGTMLPQKVSIKFSAEGYRSALVLYEATLNQVNGNVSLDPKNFQFK